MTIGAITPSGSSLRLVLVYVAIVDSILGVCSLMVVCFASSISYEVASGTNPENVTENPDKAAVRMQSLLYSASILDHLVCTKSFATCSWIRFRSVGCDSAVIHCCQKWTNQEIVYTFGRPNSFPIDLGRLFFVVTFRLFRTFHQFLFCVYFGNIVY